MLHLTPTCIFKPCCFVISAVRAVGRTTVEDTGSVRPVEARWSATSSVCRLSTGRTSSHPQVSHYVVRISQHFQSKNKIDKKLLKTFLCNQWASSRGKSSNIECVRLCWHGYHVTSEMSKNVKMRQSNLIISLETSWSRKNVTSFIGMISSQDSNKERNHSILYLPSRSRGKFFRFFFSLQFRNNLRRKTTRKYSRYSSF